MFSRVFTCSLLLFVSLSHRSLSLSLSLSSSMDDTEDKCIELMFICCISFYGWNLSIERKQRAEVSSLILARNGVEVDRNRESEKEWCKSQCKQPIDGCETVHTLPNCTTRSGSRFAWTDIQARSTFVVETMSVQIDRAAIAQRAFIAGLN